MEIDDIIEDVVGKKETPETEGLMDDELVNLINSEKNLVEQDFSELSAQRIEANYAFANLPTTGTAPTSNMSTVLDNFTTPAVEVLSTYLTKVFCSDKETVVFNPANPQMLAIADQASKMVNAVLHKHNPGYTVLSQAFRDAAINKNAVIKVTWMEDEEVIEESFDEIDEVALQNLIAQKEEMGYEVEVVEQATITEAEVAPEDAQELSSGEEQLEFEGVLEDAEVLSQTTSATIRYKVDRSRVHIENIPPEEFMINEAATSINDCAKTRFVGHRQLMYRGDIVDMFPDVDPEELQNTSGMLEYDYETQGRHYVDGTYQTFDQNTTRRETDMLELVESWVRADRDGDGVPEWRHCFTVGNLLLLDEPWFGPIPFASFTYFSIPHKFYGLSVWDMLKDLEKAATALLRSEVDMRVQQNTFRIIADPRFIDDRDLKSGRPGVIKARPGFDPKAVLPLPMPTGAGNTTQLMQELRQKVISRIGIDPVSGQISTDVEKSGNDSAKTSMVFDNASARIEKYCREFADKALRDIIWISTRLLVENKDAPSTKALAEAITPGQPFALGELGLVNILEKSDLTAKVGLGHQTGQQKVAAIQAMSTMLQQAEANPTSPLQIPPQAKIELFYEMARGFGYDNPEKLFGTIPEVIQLTEQHKQQQAAALQMQQQQLAMQQQTTQAQTAQIQSQIQLAEQDQLFKQQMEAAKHQAEVAKLASEAERGVADSDLKRAQTRKTDAEATQLNAPAPGPAEIG